MSAISKTVHVLLPHIDENSSGAAAAWVHGRYPRAHHLPATAVQISEGQTYGDAVNAAIGTVPAKVKVVVIADPTVYTSPAALRVAIAGARAYGWAMPHRWVHPVTSADTEHIVAGGRRPLPALAGTPMPAVAGTGIVAVAVDAWLGVCGYDDRFHDAQTAGAALGLALGTMVHRWSWPASPTSLAGKTPALWQLATKDRSRPAPAPHDVRLSDVRLLDEYRSAVRDTDAMAMLIGQRCSPAG